MSEFVDGGPIPAMRRLVGQAPAIVLGGLLLMAFIVTVTTDHSDDSAIELVLFGTELPLPEPVMPEEVPIPIAETVPAPPEPLPEPVVPEAPPPPQLAEKPPPPPVAKPQPKPRPLPVIPQIAKVEAPKPPPRARADRPTRERVQPMERPRVAIDQMKPRPDSVTPEPERLARAAVPRPTRARNTPRLDAPAAPAFDEKQAPLPQSTFRVAAARPTAGARPRALPGVAPAPRGPAPPPSTEPTRRTRATAPRPNAPRRSAAPAPALAAAEVPTAPQAPALVRQSRALPNKNVSRASQRPTAQLAKAPQQKLSAKSLQLASRAGRTTPSASTPSSGERPGVAGVPLGDLAACITDREEDRLKQAVVAAVKTQKECVSRKGSYRFVETKNLNSFLMWIDRAPGRSVEDRCAELHYALECLQSASQRAAR